MVRKGTPRRWRFLPALAFALAFLAAGHTLAGSPPPVVLEEIAWMGTAASPFHEWMELRNTTDAPILLDGWTLVADDGLHRGDVVIASPAPGHAVTPDRRWHSRGRDALSELDLRLEERWRQVMSRLFEEGLQ